MHRNDASHFDPLYQFVDLLVCAGVLLATLSIPGMLEKDLLSGSASFRLFAFGLGAAVIWPGSFRHLDLYASQRRVR
ncbi:MAG: hypothetical protein JRG94_25120, partial [Deltaproteobacteria bacterium]|nr:hypothetical protein [Deltaproteobacteria bacterium]